MSQAGHNLILVAHMTACVSAVKHSAQGIVSIILASSPSQSSCAQECPVPVFRLSIYHASTLTCVLAICLLSRTSHSYLS